jgi:hypothetical protein
MATLTIRDLPDEVVMQIKSTAKYQGHSMEQEIRELLKKRYASKIDILKRIQERWDNVPPTTTNEIDTWLQTGRD